MSAGPLQFEWAAHTDRGLRRPGNEDAWSATALGAVPTPLTPAQPAAPGDGLLFTVSDGIGGSRAGEVASAFCVSQLAVELAARRTEPDAAAALHAAFLATHAELARRAASRPDWHGMGATLTALWLTADGAAWFGHVGDSRLYARTGEGWLPCTLDHSVGAGLVRRGEMTAEAVQRMRLRSLLEQAMGGDGAPIEPQVGELALGPDAEFMLCSDGLHGPLGDALEDHLAATHGADLARRGDRLLAAALAAGGPDNITVLSVRARRG